MVSVTAKIKISCDLFFYVALNRVNFVISHLDDAVVFKNVFSLDLTRNFFTGREEYYVKKSYFRRMVFLLWIFKTK